MVTMAKTYTHFATLIGTALLLEWCQECCGKQVMTCRSKQGKPFLDRVCREGCNLKNACPAGCICNETEVVEACSKLDFIDYNVVSINETTSPGTRVFSIPVNNQERWSFSLVRSGQIDGSLWRTLQTYFQLKNFGKEYEMIVDKTPDLEDIFENYSVKLKELRLSMTCSRPGFLDEKTDIILRIDPVSEYAPRFIGIPLVKSIPENTAIGTVVFSMANVTIDRDVNPSANEIAAFNLHKHSTGTLTRIIQLDSLAYFSMPNPQMGLIAVKENLDYEALSALGLTQFVLNVSAVDSNGLMNYTTVTIDVTDVNDLPPEFTHPSCPLHIQRTRPCPVSFEATIATKFTGEINHVLPNEIHARDMDAIGDNIALSLDGGPGETAAHTSHFSIDNTTGTITVLSAFLEKIDIELVVVAKEESFLERMTQAPLKILVRGQGLEKKIAHSRHLNGSVSSKKRVDTDQMSPISIFIIVTSILAFFVLMLSVVSMHILCWIKKQNPSDNRVSPQPDEGGNDSQPTFHDKPLHEKQLFDNMTDSISNNNILRVENERINTSTPSSTPEYRSKSEMRNGSNVMERTIANQSATCSYQNENHYHVTCLDNYHESLTPQIEEPTSNALIYQPLGYQTIQDENGDHYRVIPVSNPVNHPHTPQNQYTTIDKSRPNSVSFTNSRRTRSFSHNEHLNLYSPLVLNSATNRRPSSAFVYRNSPRMRTTINTQPRQNIHRQLFKSDAPHEMQNLVNWPLKTNFTHVADGSTIERNEKDGEREAIRAAKEDNTCKVMKEDGLKSNVNRTPNKNEIYQDDSECESGSDADDEENGLIYSGSHNSLKPGKIEGNASSCVLVGNQSNVNNIDVLSVLPMESGISEDDAFIKRKLADGTVKLFQPIDGNRSNQLINESRFRQGRDNHGSVGNKHETSVTNSTEQQNSPQTTTTRNLLTQSSRQSSTYRANITNNLKQFDDNPRQPSRLPSLGFHKEKILRTIHPDFDQVMSLTTRTDHVIRNEENLMNQKMNHPADKTVARSQSIGNNAATQYDSPRRKKRRRRSFVRSYPERTSPHDADGE